MSDRAKQRGFTAVPMNQMGSLSDPVTLQQKLAVIRALENFPPAICTVAKVRSGLAFQ